LRSQGAVQDFLYCRVAAALHAKPSSLAAQVNKSAAAINDIAAPGTYSFAHKQPIFYLTQDGLRSAHYKDGRALLNVVKEINITSLPAQAMPVHRPRV
jgi:hypothetical protein